MPVFNPAKVAELEKQVDDASLEKSMSYTLSDAIREGSTVTGQMRGNWTDETGDNVCAMSAAVLALRARHLT